MQPKRKSSNLAIVAKSNRYVEINGNWYHPNHPLVKKSREPGQPSGFLNSPVPTAITAQIPKLKKPAPKPIPYEDAEAVLIIPGSVKSTNELKWKHWIHHFRDKKEIDQRIKETAYWRIPYGTNTLPPPQSNSRRKLLIVRVGGRMMDRINFANGCKPILDFLVSQKWLVEDSESWLDDQYMQVPGKENRIEVLFLK